MALSALVAFLAPIIVACGDADEVDAPHALDALDSDDTGDGRDTRPVGDQSEPADTADVLDEVDAPRRCVLASDAKVRLPEDDARHDAPAEWYYWTGHLQTEAGQWLGFHVTILLAGPKHASVVIAHYSLTSAATGGGPGGYRHGFDVGFEGEPRERGFAWSLGHVRAEGEDGSDTLEVDLGEARLSLTLVDRRGPFARHGDGYEDYGGGVATWYYARPRMDVSGTLVRGGVSEVVRGSAWFDHQWGTLASAASSRWDWVGAQLDDGRELMVVRLPSAEGLVGYAELTERDCSTRTFHGDAVRFGSKASWTSPGSGCTYPMGWTLGVGDLELALDPVVEDQEITADPAHYWEGAATITGSTGGRAYVELVGYCALGSGR